MPRTKLSAHMDAQRDFATLIKAQGYALYGCASNAAPHAGISQPILAVLAMVIHVTAACTGMPPMEQIRQAVVEVEMT